MGNWFAFLTLVLPQRKLGTQKPVCNLNYLSLHCGAFTNTIPFKTLWITYECEASPLHPTASCPQIFSRQSSLWLGQNMRVLWDNTLKILRSLFISLGGSSGHCLKSFWGFNKGLKLHIWFDLYPVTTSWKQFYSSPATQPPSASSRFLLQTGWFSFQLTSLSLSLWISHSEMKLPVSFNILLRNLLDQIPQVCQGHFLSYKLQQITFSRCWATM